MADARALKAFLDASHSQYHAVANLAAMLEAEGFARLQEWEPWHLSAGGKYFLIRGGSTLLAFRVPKEAPRGFLMAATHSDRPAFKLKEHPEVSGSYARLAVEPYGGMLLGTWLDRPLSIAGQVQVATEQGARARLVDIDRDLLLIPNVAIHLNREANNGQKWDVKADTLPLLGCGEDAGRFRELLAQAAGGEILGQDLYLYPRMDARIWGLDGEFISSTALDNLQCTWCCAQGFLSGESREDISLLCVFDSEEVGSTSVQGANSDLLERTLARICAGLGLELDRMLAQSFLVSADNAHAQHPNHPELADGNNAPLVNGGPVLKFQAGLRYTTDGLAAAVFRRVCQMAGVPVQTYHNRADQAGGSTLGHISMAHVSVPTADVGLPQLAMHSCYETAGTKDTGYLADAMRAYFGATLTRWEDGFAMT